MLSFVPRKLRHRPADDTAALLRRLAAGDFAALDALYRREADAVYRYAYALCGNAAWAADATQDAFLALGARPQGFDSSRGSLGAYLAGTARHGLLALRAHALRHDTLPEEPDPDSEAAGDDSPETLLVREQDRDRVWAALRALPWPFREAVVLVDLQGRPYAEAAAVAGIELNTLRTRLHRARHRLAVALRGQPGEAE